MDVKSKTKNNPLTTYHEEKFNKTLYRVTSVYLGEIDLAKALEELTIRKIIQHENSVEYSC